MVQRAHAMPDKCAQIIRLDVLLTTCSGSDLPSESFTMSAKLLVPPGSLWCLVSVAFSTTPATCRKFTESVGAVDEPKCCDDEQSPAPKKNEGSKSRQRKRAVAHDDCLRRLAPASLGNGESRSRHLVVTHEYRKYTVGALCLHQGTRSLQNRMRTDR